MLPIVALPVALSVRAPGPTYSMIACVPPDAVSWPASQRITSFGAVQPPSLPVSTTAMRRGSRSSHGSPAIASTASAPPTPTAQAPRPAAFGVCESVPRMSAPGKA